MANQQKWRPLERSEIHGPLEIQMGGKGDFHHMHAELAAGTLSLHRVARTGPLPLRWVARARCARRRVSR